MFNTLGPSFTLKWKPLDKIGGGSFTNSAYLNTDFNWIYPSPPSSPERDIWNNIWYNSTPDYYANTAFDIYQNNVSRENYHNYRVYTIAENYMYHRDNYDCCWCGCPGGYYDSGIRWGQWSECGRCYKDSWSNDWWYYYSNYRSYNIYNRYFYIDHNQGLTYQNKIYKEYSTSDGESIRREQVNPNY